MRNFEDSAFMVDLLLGTDYVSVFHDNFEEEDEKSRLENIRQLGNIVDRLRAQTIHIARSYRGWKSRLEGAVHPLERRYLSYEGLLCQQDLRQHWLLYRHAMNELHRGQREDGACVLAQCRPLTRNNRKKRRTKAA